jgi:hypothetical protein
MRQSDKATVLARTDAALATPGATELFAIPIQSRPGWRRVGLDVEVEKLTALIGPFGVRFGEAARSRSRATMVKNGNSN